MCGPSPPSPNNLLPPPSSLHPALRVGFFLPSLLGPTPNISLKIILSGDVPPSAVFKYCSASLHSLQGYLVPALVTNACLSDKEKAFCFLRCHLNRNRQCSSLVYLYSPRLDTFSLQKGVSEFSSALLYFNYQRRHCSNFEPVILCLVFGVCQLACAGRRAWWYILHLILPLLPSGPAHRLEDSPFLVQHCF